MRERGLNVLDSPNFLAAPACALLQVANASTFLASFVAREKCWRAVQYGSRAMFGLAALRIARAEAAGDDGQVRPNDPRSRPPRRRQTATHLPQPLLLWSVTVSCRRRSFTAAVARPLALSISRSLSFARSLPRYCTRPTGTGFHSPPPTHTHLPPAFGRCVGSRRSTTAGGGYSSRQ